MARGHSPSPSPQTQVSVGLTSHESGSNECPADSILDEQPRTDAFICDHREEVPNDGIHCLWVLVSLPALRLFFRAAYIDIQCLLSIGLDVFALAKTKPTSLLGTRPRDVVLTISEKLGISCRYITYDVLQVY